MKLAAFNYTFYSLIDIREFFPLATEQDMIPTHWGDIHNGEEDCQYYKFDAKPLFVAFSHKLTQSQIEDAVKTLGINCIVNLGDIAPELQAAMSQIPATSTLNEIQLLAAKVVAVAVENEAKVFFCTGEPTLTLWANNIASGLVCYEYSTLPHISTYQGNWKKWSRIDQLFYTGLKCVQSTTERKTVEVTNPNGTVTKTQVFSHVMWREMF